MKTKKISYLKKKKQWNQHSFNKELKIDENNVFTVIILKKNEVENIIFKKNQEYAITGMAIKPDIVDSDLLKVTDKKKNLKV